MKQASPQSPIKCTVTGTCHRNACHRNARNAVTGTAERPTGTAGTAEAFRTRYMARRRPRVSVAAAGLPRSLSESRMRQIRTSGLMSGEGKPSHWQRPHSQRALPRLCNPDRSRSSRTKIDGYETASACQRTDTNVRPVAHSVRHLTAPMKPLFSFALLIVVVTMTRKKGDFYFTQIRRECHVKR